MAIDKKDAAKLNNLRLERAKKNWESEEGKLLKTLEAKIDTEIENTYKVGGFVFLILDTNPPSTIINLLRKKYKKVGWEVKITKEIRYLDGVPSNLFQTIVCLH